MNPLPAVLRILRQHARALVLLFAALLLPLYGFAELAEDLRAEHGFAWDPPILYAIHSHATPARDTAAIAISAFGYLWGTVPITLAIAVLLFARRRMRDGLFFTLASVGSALLNRIVKLALHRTRPALWPSPAPETSFSFPSGHAMGSMTLAAAVVVLTWNTRARWPVLAAALVFTVSVGFSRLDLGVHFPSDVLAGWAASLSWVAGVAALFYGRSTLFKRSPDGA